MRFKRKKVPSLRSQRTHDLLRYLPSPWCACPISEILRHSGLFDSHSVLWILFLLLLILTREGSAPFSMGMSILPSQGDAPELALVLLARVVEQRNCGSMNFSICCTSAANYSQITTPVASAEAWAATWLSSGTQTSYIKASSGRSTWATISPCDCALEDIPIYGGRWEGERERNKVLCIWLTNDQQMLELNKL